MARIKNLDVFRDAGWDVGPFGHGEIAEASNGNLAVGVNTMDDKVLMNLESEQTGVVKSFLIKNDEKMSEVASVIIRHQPGLTPTNAKNLTDEILKCGGHLQAEVDGEFVKVRPD